MKIAVGSDHRGVQARKTVNQIIESLGHEVDDRGTHSLEPCDYPDIAADVARQVTAGQADRGVLLCGTGIGVAIAANKVKGVRAAVCHNADTAEMSRRHNDSNVLCVSADALNEATFRAILSIWLTTEFEGGRHKRRIDKIHQLECPAESQ